MRLPLSTSRCLWTRPCPPTYTKKFPIPPVSFLPSFTTSADPPTFPKASSPNVTPTENSPSIKLNTNTDAVPSASMSLTHSSSTSQSPKSSVAETSSSTRTNDTSPVTMPTPESSTTSPSTSQQPMAPLTSSVSLTSPSSASQSSAHPNVGAIAGGTVGGFVVLASLGLIVFLWLSRRRRHRIAPSAAYRAAYGSTPPPIYPRVQSIPPGQAHHTPLPQASENFVVSSTRSTVFDGHRPSVAF